MPHHDEEFSGRSTEEVVKILISHVLDDRVDTCLNLKNVEAYKVLVYLLQENGREVRYNHVNQRTKEIKHYRVTLDGDKVYCQMPHYNGGWQEAQAPHNVQGDFG